MKRLFGWIPLEQVLYFIMWVAIAAILGLFDFTTWRFNIYKFQDPAYWSEVGVLVVLGILVFAVTLLRKSRMLKKEDFNTQSIVDDLDKSIFETDTTKIREYVREENLERTVRQYELNQRRKLRRLLDRMPDEAIDIWMSKNDKAIRKNRYCRKRKKLETRVSTKYLKENRKNLKAKIVKLTVNFILTGVNSGAKNKEANQNPSNPVRRAIKDNWINFILPSIFVAALLAFVITASEEELLGILITVAVKLLLLLVQQFSAEWYAPVWLKATWVADTYFRRDLFTGFKNWILDELNGGDKDATR